MSLLMHFFVVFIAVSAWAVISKLRYFMNNVAGCTDVHGAPSFDQFRIRRILSLKHL